MFESGGIFYHAVAVHAAFVHECGFADVGRVFGQAYVCDFRNAPRRVGKFFDGIFGQDIVSFFELQIEYRGDEIAVSASFAESQKSALNMSRARIDRRNRVCNGKPQIVVAVYADFRALESFYDGFYDCRNFFGKSGAVRVAKDKKFRAGVFCGTQRIERVIGVFLVSVKEMFRVEKHRFVAVAKKTNAVVNHLEIILRRHLQNLFGLRNAAFSDDGNELRF